ncbi:hypothetical protein ABZ960_20640 [Streptomyces pseudovenezuelae]|uniref:hypothetical protein n=1 Tax=Streptomyces pseudovenezuelae TaxID=67350 RepID=UPI0034A5D1DD
MRYLKVDIEGKYVGTDQTIYQPLDEGLEYTAEDLERWAQDIVNQEYSWGHDVVDEADVPEDQRA